MAKKTTIKETPVRRLSRKPTQNESTNKKLNQNMDLIFEKIFPSLVVVSVSAIFYFTGWVYISHWYSYYGLDATQVNVPFQLILLHGFPGIFFLALCGLLASVSVTFYKSYIQRLKSQDSNLPSIIITAYIIASLFMLAITIRLSFLFTIPAEVWGSLLGLIVILIAYFLGKQLNNILLMVVEDVKNDELPEVKIPYVARKHLSVKKLFEIARKHSTSVALSFLLDWNMGNKTSNALEKIIEGRKNFSDTESRKIKNSFWESRQFWMITIVLFYFLISISSSALLGDWDAIRGGRFMVGNWKTPDVVIFSDKPIPVLTLLGAPIQDGYVYFNIGLLASDSQAYYLVPMKSSQYYDRAPSVFIIPRSDDIHLSFVTNGHALLGFPEFLTNSFITATPVEAPINASPTAIFIITSTP